MELDKIIVKYGADVSELKKDLGEIKNSTKGVEDAAKSLGDNVSTKLNSAFKTLGTTIAAAFAVEKIGSFISSSIQLAAEAEEIKRAFDRLNSPTLLTNLRTATEGTLSDLKLMGVALRADKLQVPLEKLGKILQFAKLRADELGKSTEELADTLLQGIGTKGTRALVQVGISQEQFSAEVKKTGDYFEALDNIMTTTLDNAGEGFTSLADKQDQLRAEIDNLKVAIGERLIPVFADLISHINSAILGMNKLFNPQDAAWQEGFDTIINMFSDGSVPAGGFEDAIKGAREQLNKLKSENPNIDNFWVKMFGGDKRRTLKETMGLISGQIDALEALRDQYNRTSSSQNDADENMKDYGESTKETTTQTWALGAALLALTKSVSAWDISGGDLYGGLGKARGQMGLARTEAQKLREEIEKLPRSTGKSLEQSLEEWDTYTYGLLSLFDSFNTAYTNSSNYRLSILEKELENGQISQDKYDKERRKILRAEANREKAFSLLSITLSTARAVMSALSAIPFTPANAAAAAIAGITGAVQLGVAAAAPIPAFAKGGLVEGKEQLIRINERGEEYVINATATRKHRDLLDAINKDKFDQYMANKYGGKDTAVSWDDYRLLLAMQKDTYVSKENTAKIVQAIKEQRKAHRF